MILIFWQNLISPHQLPYIRTIPVLNSEVEVILVASEIIPNDRKKMGWTMDEMSEIKNFSIVIAPNAITITKIFDNYPNAQHFFSGLRANSMVFTAFKLSLNRNLNRHLITEGPTFYKRPKVLHFIRTLILDKKYYKHIDKVFAIGKDAKEWYALWGFKAKNIVPFLYCVKTFRVQEQLKYSKEPVLKLLFVGRIIKLKGLKKLLKKLTLLQSGFQLDIIGDGKELVKLKKIVASNNLNNRIQFIRSKKNDEIRSIMENYDSLILPSLYDGWGAVVNEALMAGLFVICSDQCGAKELIIDKFNGIVFSHEKKDLLNALTYCIKNRDLIRSKKIKIKEWSHCIAAESISRYFLNTLTSDQTIIPPWKK